MGSDSYEKQPGFFVTFEGIDGTGKTTQFNLLAERFRKLGREVVLAKEPGDKIKVNLPDGDWEHRYIGSELGQHVRQILFFSDVKTSTNILDPEARDLLFLADHIQLYRKTIIPALKRSKVVICDRYGDSQLAYAVAKEGSPWIDELYKQRQGPVPDATILLIGEPSFLSARAKARQGTEAGKQDGKSWASDEGQRLIRDKYLKNLLDEPRTIVIEVTPEKGIDDVSNEIWEKLMDIYVPQQTGLPLYRIPAWKTEQVTRYGGVPLQMELFPDGAKAVSSSS